MCKADNYINKLRQGTQGIGISRGKATKVWLIRHVPTSWNQEGRIQGNTQTHIIKEETINFFEKMGIKNIAKPDLIIISGLDRSVETAEALKNYLNWTDIATVKDPAFNERRWGIFEGKTEEEIRKILLQDPEMIKRYPDLAITTRLASIWDDDRNFKVDGGESVNEVGKRVREGLVNLQVKYPGKKILIVTHTGILVSQNLDLTKLSAMTINKDPNTGNILLTKN